MKLTLKTDFSLRVLIFLMENEKATIKEIATHYKISKNHLSFAVNQLSELGFIQSTPGPGGGIRLNPATLEKTVYDLVVQTEEFEIAECFNNKKNTCILTSSCRLKSILGQASSSFLKELKKHKIKDLAN